MGTPEKVKQAAWSPVKYDVEDLNTHIDTGLLKEIASEARDPCAITDAECLKKGRGPTND